MSSQDILPDGTADRRRKPYECRTCGQRYELEYYVCPECEGFSVERA
jgi:lipopolysaccharide biosynthesis regulator YciM